jgi:exopolyphosphatase/guanosine-5'-triphosphate,3'-diphosphate pyrophosphatase
VSARDEARLIYLAVRHAMPLGDQPHFIMDIGGGSVEFIVGDAKKAALLESRKLGASRMSARFVSTDPISSEQQKTLRRHYERELVPICASIDKLHPVKAIGTSGTMENLAAMCAADSDSNGHGAEVIDGKRFKRMLATLLKTNVHQRAHMRGLDDGRKDQVIAGALLVDEIFERLKLKRIQLCGSALREGILLDYLSRHIPDLDIRREVPDPRRRSVLDLARRCDWHQAHSEHVAALTLKLFDELRSLHSLGSVERELIEYGAMLHDIGWHIGRKSHHKHSMYLIANGDLKEFSPEEVRVIANIARYHRKSTPKKNHKGYAELSHHSKRIVDVGAALLRIADGLDRSHASVIQSLNCKVGEHKARCRLVARSDAEFEIWGARRKMEMFDQVFGRKMSIELAKA